MHNLHSLYINLNFVKMQLSCHCFMRILTRSPFIIWKMQMTRKIATGPVLFSLKKKPTTAAVCGKQVSGWWWWCSCGEPFRRRQQQRRRHMMMIPCGVGAGGLGGQGTCTTWWRKNTGITADSIQNHAGKSSFWWWWAAPKTSASMSTTMSCGSEQ